MKKVLVFLLATAMLLTLCACGEDIVLDDSYVSSTSSEEINGTSDVTSTTDSTTTRVTQQSRTDGSSLAATGGTAASITTSQPSLTPTKTTTHTHRYKITDVLEATCTEDGINTFTCTDCMYTYNDTVPATGHYFTDRGLCAKCGQFCRHDWDKGVVERQPTCTEYGEIVYTCKSCGETHYDVSLHNEGYSHPVAIRKEACVEPGEYYYVCRDCGEKFLKDVPPVGYHVDEDEDGRCDGCGDSCE